VVGLLGSTVTGVASWRCVCRQRTVADPRLRGEISGDQLSIEQVESGVFLREGVLRATFADRAVRLDTFTIRGGEGRFGATGALALRGRHLDLNLDWAAEKLTAVQHPDLRLVVSGKGNVRMQEARTSLRGALTADYGRVELRSNTAPALGEDVIVAGRKPKAAISARTLRPQVDLALDLGPDFVVRGRGLDARLVGKVTVLGAGDAPLEAKGQISVARGTYEAYGQRLEIDKGVLYFSGPLDNPGLQIVALRRLAVEASVEVTGTARDPRVAGLKPEVPDSGEAVLAGAGTRRRGAGIGRQAAGGGIALAAGLGTAPAASSPARWPGRDRFIRRRRRLASGLSRRTGQAQATASTSPTSAACLRRPHHRLNYRLSAAVRASKAGTAEAVDVFTLSFD
jgi:translocation and assembly module TamB